MDVLFDIKCPICGELRIGALFYAVKEDNATKVYHRHCLEKVGKWKREYLKDIIPAAVFPSDIAKLKAIYDNFEILVLPVCENYFIDPPNFHRIG